MNVTRRSPQVGLLQEFNMSEVDDTLRGMVARISDDDLRVLEWKREHVRRRDDLS